MATPSPDAKTAIKTTMMNTLFPPPEGVKWEFIESIDTWRAYLWHDYGRVRGDLKAEVKCNVFDEPRLVSKEEMVSYLQTRNGAVPLDADAHAARRHSISEAEAEASEDA